MTSSPSPSNHRRLAKKSLLKRASAQGFFGSFYRELSLANNVDSSFEVGPAKFFFLLRDWTLSQNLYIILLSLFLCSSVNIVWTTPPLHFDILTNTHRSFIESFLK